MKEYFIFYHWLNSNITVDIRNGVSTYKTNAENWRVTLVDTGEKTQTAGRLRRVATYLDPDRPFCLTYGDGVSDIDISASIAFHHKHGRLATITAVHPPPRFGALSINHDGVVTHFDEKPPKEGGRINGGFFIMSPKTFGYLGDDDNVPLECEPLQRLADDGQLIAFRHDGFWHPMDTLRDRRHLEDLWASGKAPWKTWSDTENAAERVARDGNE